MSDQIGNLSLMPFRVLCCTRSGESLLQALVAGLFAPGDEVGKLSHFLEYQFHAFHIWLAFWVSVREARGPAGGSQADPGLAHLSNSRGGSQELLLVPSIEEHYVAPPIGIVIDKLLI